MTRLASVGFLLALSSACCAQDRPDESKAASAVSDTAPEAQPADERATLLDAKDCQLRDLIPSDLVGTWVFEQSTNYTHWGVVNIAREKDGTFTGYRRLPGKTKTLKPVFNATLDAQTMVLTGALIGSDGKPLAGSKITLVLIQRAILDDESGYYCEHPFLIGRGYSAENRHRLSFWASKRTTAGPFVGYHYMFAHGAHHSPVFEYLYHISKGYQKSSASGNATCWDAAKIRKKFEQFMDELLASPGARCP